MSFQNRVNPYGEICFTHHRGKYMGNRGHLHNEKQAIIRNYQLKRWIFCLLDFKERKRTIMQPGRYTELFFLDEVTALAAGHRPCAECQRYKYEMFKNIWCESNHLPSMSAPEMDEYLHAERTNQNKILMSFKSIPDFVMVEFNSKPYLKYMDQIFEWSFGGYNGPGKITTTEMVRVLTPPSIINTIRAGYTPEFSQQKYSVDY